MRTLSGTEARRIALVAQGFAKPRHDNPGKRQFDAMTARLGLLQIDSVNVFARAHCMPGFSRLGRYDPGLIDTAATARRGTLFEYWGHEASFIRRELQPALRWRMARAEAGQGLWSGTSKFGAERRPFIDSILAEVAARGPLTVGDLEDGGKAHGSWWGWSDGKRALEWLFWAGKLTSAGRRGFARIYDLPERVMPDILALPTPTPADAQRTLLAVAARALGVATTRDLRDYWRINPADAAAGVADLAESGEIEPVLVKGWAQPAWLARGSSGCRPRQCALVSPFDPLLWYRDRAERLFDFRYRLEIYTPAHKREHGYYVLPFLMGDRIAARVDLKADRSARCLLVQSAYLEHGVDPEATATALAHELQLAAHWTGCDRVQVMRRGNLSAALQDRIAAQ